MCLPFLFGMKNKGRLFLVEEIFNDGKEFGAIDDGERPLRNEVDGEDDERLIAVFGVVFTEGFLHVHGAEL